MNEFLIKQSTQVAVNLYDVPGGPWEYSKVRNPSLKDLLKNVCQAPLLPMPHLRCFTTLAFFNSHTALWGSYSSSLMCRRGS